MCHQASVPLVLPMSRAQVFSEDEYLGIMLEAVRDEINAVLVMSIKAASIAS